MNEEKRLKVNPEESEGASMSSCKGVCRDCEHAECTSVWDQYWCTSEDSTYYDCRRNGDEYCKAFEERGDQHEMD